MLDLPCFRACKGICDHRVIGHGLKRQWGYEFCRMLGHDDMHIHAFFAQKGDDCCAFVRGNASRHAKHDLRLVHGVIPPRPYHLPECHMRSSRG